MGSTLFRMICLSFRLLSKCPCSPTHQSRMDAAPPLPNFERLPLSHRYSVLHRSLWPTLSHKDRLSQFIKKTTVDLNFWEATRNDPIPYIALEHSIFGIYQLAFEPFLIIRQEYYDFMPDVIAEVENGQVKGYFLTGQPGNIGK